MMMFVLEKRRGGGGGGEVYKLNSGRELVCCRAFFAS